MLEDGVTILQPETVTIEHDVEVGRDTVIYPCTYLGAGTRIGKNCAIGPFAFLKNARVNDGERLEFVKKGGLSLFSLRHGRLRAETRPSLG